MTFSTMILNASCLYQVTNPTTLLVFTPLLQVQKFRGNFNQSSLGTHDSLKRAFMGDLMSDPKALANTLIRLQKAESRLADYISNFPGIFFTQRPDLSFSYLSNGIKKLYPMDYAQFHRSGGFFLDKLWEQDREHFKNELQAFSGQKETFSFTYRIKTFPEEKIMYLLDVRTPIITSNQNFSVTTVCL